MPNNSDYYNESPGVSARNYMRRLEANGYNRLTANINIKELETRLAGVCLYDDVEGKIELCIQPDFDPDEAISLWTDGSIVKEENAIAGIGIVGLNSRNEVVILGAASITSSEKGMDIYDVENIGVLLGVKISDDFLVDNIYCDNKTVIANIDASLKRNNYPLNAVWTKGHAEDQCNILADGLAKHGRHRAKRENIIINKPLNLRYTPGTTNKRTGWSEVYAKGFDRPMLYKEDTLILDKSNTPIKNVYIWEREMPSSQKGVSSQYIISHCDENNRLLSMRRGLIHNPDSKSGRFLNTNFIASRLPKNNNNINLTLSGFMASRYKHPLHMKSYKVGSHQEFIDKMNQYGYAEINTDPTISSSVFNGIMNKSHTLAIRNIEELVSRGLNQIEESKQIAKEFQKQIKKKQISNEIA